VALIGVAAALSVPMLSGLWATAAQFPPTAGGQVSAGEAGSPLAALPAGPTMPGEQGRLMARQAELTRLAGRLEARIPANRYGGSWLDQRSRQLVVHVTSDAPGVAPRQPGVQVRRVEYTLAELNRAKDLVDQSAETFGLRQGTWFVDVPNNAVVIRTNVPKYLDGAATTAFLAAVRALRPVRIQWTRKPLAKDGDRGEVNGAPKAGDSAAAPPVSPIRRLLTSAVPTLVGGVGINNLRRTCTAGFWAKDRANKDVMLTAGHCLAANGVSRWTMNGRLVGEERGHAFRPQDWGAIGVGPDSGVALTARVRSGPDSTAPVRGYASGPVGALACKTGRTTGTTCGSIMALNASTVYRDGSFLKGVGLANMCNDRGDSGGAVFSPTGDGGVFAQGLLSGGPPGCTERDLTVFQPIGKVLGQAGLKLMVRSGR
jgi:hypothetical protein